MWAVLTLVVYCRVAAATTRLLQDGEHHVHLDHVMLDNAARRVLQEENELLSQACSRAIYANWEYQTNLTEQNRKAAMTAQDQYKSIKLHSWETVKRWRGLQTYLLSKDIHRQFAVMSVVGTSALPKSDLEEYKNVLSSMSSTYSRATVCKYRNPSRCDLSISEDLEATMRTSRDPGELSYIWRSWRDNTGKMLREQYKNFVNLENKAARYNGFRNMASMNFVPYETSDFRPELAQVWEQVKPLYEQLHAYARRKLREVYGSKLVRERGPIPAHLLGNMWAQKWDIKDLLIPYPWETPIDVTEEMVKQGYTPLRIFKVAERFFTSMNMTEMPFTFWRHSIFEEPADRKIVCHASAWDFCNSYDYRIKHCTKVTMKDLITAHHEMSHVQYFLNYADQPYVYRGGANPGFHEAVSSAISLSVSTPKHLHRIGLMNYLYNDYPADINRLMEKAMDELAFLPFAYAMDLWRWNVLDGSMEEKDWNCDWWDLRYELQGLKPPRVRTEHDFDPGSKFNLLANHPYDRYFVSIIAQFQIYRALCEKAGEYEPGNPSKPLHKCDVYQSPEAGALLKDILKAGASKPWREVMATYIGDGRLDASALREYFLPLEDWLIRSNAKHSEFVGWKPDDEYCVYREPSPHREACKE